MGPGIAEGTTLGPMIEPKALTKIEELVADAVDRGARVLTGGRRPTADELPEGCADGFYYLPTVLADVPLDARVHREEIFGPVAPITVMDDVEAMVRAANDTEFGLMSYAVGADLTEVTQVAGRIESGMVAVNLGVASDAAAPFGGVKESGLGREGSHEGLDEYLETTYVRLPL